MTAPADASPGRMAGNAPARELRLRRAATLARPSIITARTRAGGNWPETGSASGPRATAHRLDNVMLPPPVSELLPSYHDKFAENLHRWLEGVALLNPARGARGY